MIGAFSRAEDAGYHGGGYEDFDLLVVFGMSGLLKGPIALGWYECGQVEKDGMELGSGQRICYVHEAWLDGFRDDSRIYL